jgi:hypothetical protein
MVGFKYVVGRICMGHCEWFRENETWLPKISKAKVFDTITSARSVVFLNHCGKVVPIHPDNIREGQVVVS